MLVVRDATLEEVLRNMGILNLYACIGYPEQEDEYLIFLRG